MAKTRYFVLVSLVALAFAALATMAASSTWFQTDQLTNNAFGDSYPQISGDKIIWSGKSGALGTREIYFYDGSTVTKLTNDSNADDDPQVSGNKAVWYGEDGPGNTREIYLYDGSTVTRLTNNAFGDDEPQISGDKVVWQGAGGPGNTREIYLYDGSTVTTLTNNSFQDRGPQISGDNIVWRGVGGPGGTSEIYFYNGSSVTTLTSNTFNDYGPQISGDKAVWYGEGGPGGTSEIYFYNGSSVTALTSNSFDDSNPQISGDEVVWHGAGGSGGGEEIYRAKFDWVKPAASVKINNGETYTRSVKGALKIQASDSGGSGLGMMRFKDDGGSWTAWEAYASSKTWTLPTGDGEKKVWVEVKDQAGNKSAAAFDTIKLDSKKPTVKMVAPFVSTRISKRTSFKVKWSATDPAPGSGVKNYTVRYRPSTSKKWRTHKANTTTTQSQFKGKAGVTYYFRTYAYDNAGNKGWSKVYKTVVPFNEGIFLRKIGFFGYKKLGRSQNYLSSVRYSYGRGHTLVYKLYRTNGIGLVVTKGPKMGRAKIYVDGKHVRTVDAHKSKTKARQLIYYKGFTRKGTHYLKVVKLGTPGRTKFEVDGVVVKR